MNRFNKIEKMVLVVEGDQSKLKMAYFKSIFGEQEVKDVPQEKLDAFHDSFSAKFRLGDEDEDDVFRIKIDYLDNLVALLTAFKEFKTSLYLESEEDGISFSHCLYNKNKARHERPESNNALWVSIRPEKFGVEAQERIEKAIKILQGKP